MSPLWGGRILLIGPILALLALRLRGPIRPVVAFLTGILAEFASLVLFILWVFVVVRWHLISENAGYATMVLWSDPSLGHRVLGLGLLALYGCLIAAIFLLFQWLAVRLTSAWSRRGSSDGP